MAGVRILVADDDPGVSEALRELLEAEPDVEPVGTAGSTSQAVELAAALTPDVAIVDVRMPGGGEAATRGIIARSPQTRVLALSAHGEWSTVLSMLRAGACGYLLKGASADEIIDGCRYVARGEAVLTREVTAHVVRELVGQLDRAEELSAQFRELDRTKSELIQILAHELLTPMTVVKGFVRTLQRPGLSREMLDTVAASISRSVDRFARLVRNICAAAELVRPGESRPTRPVPVRALLDATVERFPDDAHRLEVRAPEATLWADPDLAVRALVLVVENALEVSSGPVELSASPGDLDVRLRVADRGPGIPPETLTRVFEAFTQTDSSETRSRGGLGLGLYLVARIMDAMSGSVGAAARDGGGTVLTLTFPAVLPLDAA